MKKTIQRWAYLLCLIFFIFIFAAPVPIFAQGTPPAPAAPSAFGLESLAQTGLASQDIRITIAKIIRAILALLGTIALVLVLYAGYLIMTAAGNEEKIATGKQVLKNSIIGLAIILSALTIVQFILNSLAAATGYTGGGLENANGPAFDTFAGSGALGRAVKDHYPERDQKNVPRNTKIAVTFREPIEPSSLITDTTGDGIFGNCKATITNWSTDCDQLKTNVVKIYKTADATKQGVAAAALAVPEGPDHNVLTVVFRPIDNLGSDTEKVDYTVDLTSAIERKRINNQPTAPSIFDHTPGGHYDWPFQTDTLLDLTPPRVVRVYPGPGATVDKNSIVQIEFDGPMDPTGVQGLVENTSNFTNIVFGDPAIRGEWKITNGYKTVEFVSALDCGVLNTCGEKMYCLPPRPTGSGEVNDRVLIRTAQLAHQGTPPLFEAVPFTGVTDMAGNALDGNNNQIGEGQPLLSADHKTIGGSEFPAGGSHAVADDYGWKFGVVDRIDATAPYVSKVSPGIDQESVAGGAPLKIYFSKSMWESTLDVMALEEFGLPSSSPVDPIWFHPTEETVANQTIVTMEHRVFGPNNLPAYYFPSVPSKVKSVTQNCLYPGVGPFSTTKSLTDSECHPGTADCVAVNTGENSDTGCVQTTSPGNVIKANIADCLSVSNGLKDPLISPK